MSRRGSQPVFIYSTAMAKSPRSSTLLEKMPTGIPGLDEILHGGLPQGKTTLLLGGPGSGKTVLALQTLANGARQRDESGIFVAFEESPSEIIRHAASFGWNLSSLQKRHLFFLDARLGPDSVKAGAFDLTGLLAIVAEKAREMKADRVVFDGIDVLLTLLDDPAAERRELFRLHRWLQDNRLTGILTAKSDEESPSGTYGANLQFMTDCVILLKHFLQDRISLRNLWVMKYRGSSFSENEAPLSIERRGLEVSAGMRIDQEVPVTKRRISTGVPRLDAMLDGGYFRGASILITGSPGTSKSTLSAAFAAAACQRGERVVYVSFDESADELARNFSSVNIHLAPHIRNGRLLVHSVMADICSAKQHYSSIRDLLDQHQSTCLVIDPLSALIKGGGDSIAQIFGERLMRLGKSRGITMVNTSLLHTADQQEEATSMQISTIADTWIHLSYLVQGGERNRALTIVKSRGMAHSNQVRELILSNQGLTLADAYTAGGEVLMGTLRWQREEAEAAQEVRDREGVETKRREMEIESERMAYELKLLERSIAVKKSELQQHLRSEHHRQDQRSARANALSRKRRSDVSPQKGAK